MKKKDRKNSRLLSVGLIASLLSLVTLSLLSLGYGVSYAAESIFGMPHASLFGASLDLVDLSGVAVMMIGELGDKYVLDIQSLFSHIYAAAPGLLALSAYMIVLWLVVLGLVSWVSMSKLTGIRDKARRSFQFPSKADSIWDKCRSFVWPISLFMVMVLAAWGILFIGVLFSVSLAALPVIGFELGRRHIVEWVINADVCAPVATLAERREALVKHRSTLSPVTRNLRPVLCVAVIKSGAVVAKGRVVLATPSAILLFDPNSGAVRRESLADAAVETIDLGVPAGASVAIPVQFPGDRVH